jgi:putative sigma-54 modulation protein
MAAPSSRHLSIEFRPLAQSEAVKAHATRKLSQLQKFLRQPMTAKVTISVDKLKHVAEARISSGGEHLEAKESSDDMYASIDRMIEKLDRQIRATKGAAAAQRRTSKAAAAAPTKPRTAMPKDERDSLAHLVEQAGRRAEISLPLQVRSGLRENEMMVVVVGRDNAVARRFARADGAIGLREIGLAVEGAKIGFLQLERRLAAAASDDLSVDERALLAEGKFETFDGDGVTPFESGELEYLTLVTNSLSPLQAARLLSVNTSRVRQRLGARQLFGIKDKSRWRLPRFQFVKNRLVPGIDRVFPELAPTLHPVAVQQWFRLPNPDLETENGAALTPLEWLTSGRDPASVMDLAKLL